MKLYKLKFKTQDKTIDDVKKDYPSRPPSQNICEKIAEAYRGLNGCVVIGGAWSYSPETYGIYAAVDDADEKLKEFVYWQEQDEIFGNYIDDRERFDKDWANEEYEPPAALHFARTDFEVLEELI